MYTKKELLLIYASAYFDKTGVTLTNEQLDKITYYGYSFMYNSWSDITKIEIWDFNNQINFPYPNIIILQKEKGKCWVLE